LIAVGKSDEGPVMLKNRLTEVLDDKDVRYELIHHRADYSALETAHDTHTPGREFAKSVVLTTSKGPYLAVLPAPLMVDVAGFAKVVGAEDVRLANEDTIAELFPDCDVGAEPPFGSLYGLRVVVDESLAGQEHITFNAGTHDEAIRMRFADFERLERPRRARVAARA
jgi:Ala-tRNA(Pro) deacylase